VLARGALRATELDPGLPAELPASIRRLGDAIRQTDATFDRPDRSSAIDLTLQAVDLAGSAYAADGSLPVAHVVGQVRSAATDLLQALGIERVIAIERVRQHAGAYT
jgi:hypothetical protein